MENLQESAEIVIVGAGPIGLACAIEAKKNQLSAVVIEKGCLTNSIFHFPTNLTFFSSPDLLELGDIPFITSGPKPTRAEILNYYKRLTQHFDLNVKLFERVIDIRREGDFYYVRTDRRNSPYVAHNVILAIGFFDHPNYLNVPGEELPKVSHYYKEAHQYYGQKVAVIGAQNSAVEAALEIYRAGAAEVSLIHRGPTLGGSIKYWIRPDIENRIREGSIKAHFNTRVKEIREKSILLSNSNGEIFEMDNDFVLAMTGYHPDYDFLQRAGVDLDRETRKPIYNPETMETDRERMYIAGVATGGKKDINKIFIENGRDHARLIIRDIQAKNGKNR